jgi:imidazolonepropionase-like amidohydrolase
MSALLALLAFAAPLAQAPEPQRWLLRSDRIVTGTGRVLSGVIEVRNGQISLVGSDAGSEDDPADNKLQAYAITAGLIDASPRLGGPETVEQSSEVTPNLRVADALDPFDPAFERLVRCGVTSVLAAPLDQNVIGGLGAVLKTAGPESIAERTVKADAVLRGSMGGQPSSGNRPAFGRPTTFFNRRPTTRMGVEWEWRKAFFDTALERNTADPGRAVLVSALKGELPVFVQAWVTQDIRTAVFLREEVQSRPEFAAAGLNRPRFVIDAAAEAWKEPQLLSRSGTAVVLPPFPADGRTGERALMAANVAKVLKESGVPFALSSHGSGDPESCLAAQAGYAMAGGIGFEDALAAVTSVPARLLGVEDRVGTIEVGKDADLVLWSGEPFEPGSRVVVTIVGGALAYDGRAAVRGAEAGR